VSGIEAGRTLLLWCWAFGLGAIEIEIEGGYGWAERLPTWFRGRGLVGRTYGTLMGQRPLTGYHVYAFVIPMLILHLPFVYGYDWTLARELTIVGTYFALAVVWDYLWFVLNPAYTVKRFRRGSVWWFEVPWIWRFPLDYCVGIGLSIALAALGAWSAGDLEPLYDQLWMLAGFAVLTAAAVLAAPLYHRWYIHMRRDPELDDRKTTHMYPPPAPEAAWAAGAPELRPLEPTTTDERRPT
jgi:hypothetical protein